MAMRAPQPEKDRIAVMLRKLEGNASEEVSTGASIALVRMGLKDRAAQRELVDRVDSTPMFRHLGGFLSDSLALANEPRLREKIELKEAVETDNHLNAALKPLGLRVEFDWPTADAHRTSRAHTAFELIERHTTGSRVIERGVIRPFRNPWQALERWREILKVDGSK